MSSEYLLTVIVPVYNLENYIENCITSLINQSFANLHIIIIDDASTDETYNILLKYKYENSNITIYRNSTNRGVSYCRNFGISLVKTKYVAFLDGDDWIDCNCYTKAIRKLEENNSVDIALWNIQTVYSRSQYLKRYYYDEENVISNVYALKLFGKSLNSNIHISPLLGNKVIRMRLISEHNIRFHGFFYEDDIFIFKCLLFSNKIQLLTDTNLYYFQRDNSIMHSFSEEMIAELFEEFPDFRRFLIKNKLWVGNEQYYYSYYEKCIQNLLVIMRNSVQTEYEERQLLYKLFKGFYEKMPIEEYTKYCDLSLFPF